MLIDPQLQRTAQAHLETDEKLLWAGKPDPRRMTAKTSGSLILRMAWPTFILISVWCRSGPSSGYFYGWDLSTLIIWVIPAVGVGLTGLVSPLWRYLRATKTTYAITDRRVIVVEAMPRRTIQSYTARDIGIIARVDITNGVGDLFYAQRKDQEDDKGKFIGIPDVGSVEALMRSIFKKQ